MIKSVTRQQTAVVTNMMRGRANELKRERREGLDKTRLAGLLLEEFGGLLRLLGFRNAEHVVLRAIKDFYQVAELAMVDVPPLSLKAQARARGAERRAYLRDGAQPSGKALEIQAHVLHKLDAAEREAAALRARERVQRLSEELEAAGHKVNTSLWASVAAREAELIFDGLSDRLVVDTLAAEYTTYFASVGTFNTKPAILRLLRDIHQPLNSL